MDFPFVWLFLSSFVASCAAMPLARRLGAACGLMDHPHERKLQNSAVPRTGGIGLLLGLVAGLVVLGVFSRALGVPLGRDIFAICAGGVLIHAIGVMDDLWDLPARLKLLAQSAAVALVVSQGVFVESIVLPGGGEFHLGFAGIPLTAFFLLGIVNCINLVDGLDGLASGIGAVAAFALGITGVFSGNAVLTALSITLLGAILGFLPFNLRRKEKIFLGDSGSMLIGWTLGVIAIIGSRFAGESTPLFVVVAATIVPVFDTATTILRRARNNLAIFRPDSMHIHHRLIRFGMTSRAAVVTILAITLFSTGQTIALLVEGTRILLVPAALSVAIVVLQLRRPRPVSHDAETDDASFREIVLYLLGTQEGRSPRMSGELSIVDLLRDAAPNGTGRPAPSPAKPIAVSPSASEREPAPARTPIL